MTLTQKVKSIAREIGFHAVGVTRFGVPEEAEQRFFAWRAKGYAAEMKFLARYEERRDAFLEEASWARSVIVLGVNYFRKESSGEPPRPGAGRVARYAWGADYHQASRARHEALITRLKRDLNPEARFLSSIDTRPVFERELAHNAGLGFIGKQGHLISLQFGPWLFLSELITDLELEPDVPHLGSCGSCRLCLDACPTGALVGARELDARRCIAYHTIENPGEIPEEIAAKMGRWFFGCDVCLAVCPYAAKSKETDWEEFRASDGEWVDPETILSLKSQGEFRRKFGRRAISRISRKQAVRNAQTVLENAQLTNFDMPRNLS